MWIIIWLRVEKLNIYWIVFHVGDHRPGRGHITDLFSWFYLLFAGELVGSHFWPMSVARPENSQNFCDQREIPPSPSPQCSATDTKLDNNWKCQQGLICPHLTGLFKDLTVHVCKPRSVVEHSSICASDWLTCRYSHLWLVSLLSAQVSVCPPVWAWCLNAKWISLQIVSRGWQQKSSLKMDTNISIRTLSWTYDTRESNLNTAGIRTLGPYKHHDIGY